MGNRIKGNKYLSAFKDLQDGYIPIVETLDPEKYEKTFARATGFLCKLSAEEGYGAIYSVILIGIVPKKT